MQPAKAPRQMHPCMLLRFYGHYEGAGVVAKVASRKKIPTIAVPGEGEGAFKRSGCLLQRGKTTFRYAARKSAFGV